MIQMSLLLTAILGDCTNIFVHSHTLAQATTGQGSFLAWKTENLYWHLSETLIHTFHWSSFFISLSLHTLLGSIIDLDLFSYPWTFLPCLDWHIPQWWVPKRVRRLGWAIAWSPVQWAKRAGKNPCLHFVLHLRHFSYFFCILSYKIHFSSQRLNNQLSLGSVDFKRKKRRTSPASLCKTKTFHFLFLLSPSWQI